MEGRGGKVKTMRWLSWGLGPHHDEGDWGQLPGHGGDEAHAIQAAFGVEIRMSSMEVRKHL